MFLVKILLAPLLFFSHPPIPAHPQTEAGYGRWINTHASEPACLKALWSRESKMNRFAQNPTSGAYGIPQALPGEKMASAGEDWRTNGYTQMRWGLHYVTDRYGTPCAALAHSNLHGWY